MQVGQFWLITTDTIKGPWHVGSKSGGKNWYIVNKDTGESHCIGPVRKSGRNFCDEAKAEAKRRNRALGYKND